MDDLENTTTKDSIKLEIPFEKIVKAFELAAEEIFKSSYSNPVKTILESSLKDKEGQIKIFIDGLISNALADPKVKERMGEAVLSRMIESALRRN